MNKKDSIIKKITGSAMLPVIMFVIMLIICNARGITYFGTVAMWKTIIVDITVSVTCAFGIGIQFKNGRFDFSGGAIMLLAAIIAGNVSQSFGSNKIIFIMLSMALCIGLSMGVGLLYSYGRLPIIIATIGIALLYEAITCVLYNGSGVKLIADTSLKSFSTYPLVLVPLAAAIIIYAFYSYKTIAGKKGQLLANNQQAAVNIGIGEIKNVLITYLFSGILFGCATIVYASTDTHAGSFSSLATVGELFVNILPVFIGLIIARYCGDTLGIILGSLTICLMNFGLKAAFTAEIGSAVSTICIGVFMLVVNVAGSQGGVMVSGLKHMFQRQKSA